MAMEKSCFIEQSVAVRIIGTTSRPLRENANSLRMCAVGHESRAVSRRSILAGLGLGVLVGSSVEGAAGVNFDVDR